MTVEHVAAVSQLERQVFSRPWPESAYWHELEVNPHASYFVLAPRQASHTRPSAGRWWRRLLSFAGPAKREWAEVLGYAGLWMNCAEAHISTIAVAPELRGRGLGELLLATLIDHALSLGACIVTLEVRVSNVVAGALYAKYGFTRVGRRKAYYADNREDAWIMSTPELTDPAWRSVFERNIRALAKRGWAADHVRATSLRQRE
jgi:ribosomal-protein-alanine N-acetyltransferase